MPLYLARGPATVAFLIRARDRDHLNYLIDAVCDPGGFEAEVYDGPLNLMLSLPAEATGARDYASAEPGLRITFTGSVAREELFGIPDVLPMTEFLEDWEHLRRLAFPAFAQAVDEFIDNSEIGDDADRTILEEAIARDLIERGRSAFWKEERAPDDAEERERLGVTVPLDSLMSGADTHQQWRISGWEEGSLDDSRSSASASPAEMAVAVERFGEVCLAITAAGLRWRVGDPVVGEGVTLADAIAAAERVDVQ